MKSKLFLFGLVACLETVGLASLSFAALEPEKLKIVYSSLTGAYTPLWIAVEKRLGRKYGLDLESVYIGRGVRPHQLLISGDAQYVASTGTGVVASYAAGLKDLVILASFADTTGSSVFSKPEIKALLSCEAKLLVPDAQGVSPIHCSPIFLRGDWVSIPHGMLSSEPSC